MIHGITEARSMATLLSSINHAISSPGIYVTKALTEETVKTIGNRLYIGHKAYAYTNTVSSESIPQGCYIIKLISHRICSWNSLS